MRGTEKHKGRVGSLVDLLQDQRYCVTKHGYIRGHMKFTKRQVVRPWDFLRETDDLARHARRTGHTGFHAIGEPLNHIVGAAFLSLMAVMIPIWGIGFVLMGITIPVLDPGFETVAMGAFSFVFAYGCLWYVRWLHGSDLNAAESATGAGVQSTQQQIPEQSGQHRRRGGD